MEDTSIEGISADTGKPKKQLPKNFRKFFFVAAVILFFRCRIPDRRRL